MYGVPAEKAMRRYANAKKCPHKYMSSRVEGGTRLVCIHCSKTLIETYRYGTVEK